ncbi:hypothetical protein Hdeb2414_s0013g00419961 [Helianthus debilis subsp. tardiflorus]
MRWWLTAVFVLNFPHRNPFPSLQKNQTPISPHKNSFPSGIQKIKPQNFLSSSIHLPSPPSVSRLLNLEAHPPEGWTQSTTTSTSHGSSPNRRTLNSNRTSRFLNTFEEILILLCCRDPVEECGLLHYLQWPTT